MRPIPPIRRDSKSCWRPFVQRSDFTRLTLGTYYVLKVNLVGSASFSCWRSLVIITTFQASPSRFIARITHPPGSTSHHRRPCSAERGNAWWLWCHDSPKEGSASQKTLVDWSSVRNRRWP